MIPLFTLFGILFTHHVGDFMMQTHYQATNKWQSMAALTGHIARYCAILLLFCAVYFCTQMPAEPAIALTVFGKLMVWASFNTVAHFVTDLYTSKWVHKKSVAAQENFFKYHDFFVAINCDQMLHYAALYISWYAIMIMS